MCSLYLEMLVPFKIVILRQWEGDDENAMKRCTDMSWIPPTVKFEL